MKPLNKFATFAGRRYERKRGLEGVEVLAAVGAAKVALNLSWGELDRIVGVASPVVSYRWRTGERVPSAVYLARLMNGLLQELAEGRGLNRSVYLDGEAIEVRKSKKAMRTGIDSLRVMNASQTRARFEEARARLVQESNEEGP